MCGDASTDRVIFTGALIGTDTTESNDIIEQLQTWVKNEPTIIVQGVHLKVIACVVRMEEGAKPRCIPLYTPAPPTREAIIQEEESGSLGFPLYIGIAGGVLVLLICVTATIIIAVVVMKRRQKKQAYRMNSARSALDIILLILHSNIQECKIMTQQFLYVAIATGDLLITKHHHLDYVAMVTGTKVPTVMCSFHCYIPCM